MQRRDGSSGSDSGFQKSLLVRCMQGWRRETFHDPMPVVSIDHRVDIAREGPAASSFRHIVTSGRRRAGDIALHSSMQGLFHVARSSKESVGLRPSNRFFAHVFSSMPECLRIHLEEARLPSASLLSHKHPDHRLGIRRMSFLSSRTDWFPNCGTSGVTGDIPRISTRAVRYRACCALFRCALRTLPRPTSPGQSARPGAGPQTAFAADEKCTTRSGKRVGVASRHLRYGIAESQENPKPSSPLPTTFADWLRTIGANCAPASFSRKELPRDIRIA